MARRKGGGTRRQGIVSWLTSVLALILGLFPVWRSLQAHGFNLEAVGNDMNRLYNPLMGDKAALATGYGSIVGGIVFKAVTSELIKRTRVRSIIPALRA